MHIAPRDAALVLISGAGLALTAEERERESLGCVSGWVGLCKDEREIIRRIEGEMGGYEVV